MSSRQERVGIILTKLGLILFLLLLLSNEEVGDEFRRSPVESNEAMEAIDVQFSHSLLSSNLFLLPVTVDKGGREDICQQHIISYYSYDLSFFFFF